ncbi:D-alanyl-D-alanine carboxypeptidase family protein [Defluviitalea saccharophila]|uniref:serine-type D-Ala-D-Ala carboxypeptidase n=1 Tax=Defluviitalea saccharophila TaxID=879970 RepID=A0ABZ2Y477_9FIRM
MKRKFCFVLTFMFLLMNIVPISAQETSLPLQSEAVILIEENTGKVLYEKNSSQKMYPASTTKVLTALIALENADLNEVIKVGNEVYQVPLDASKAGHNPGDEITLKDLVTSLLLPSGNDSAFVIASYLAKKNTGNDSLDINSAMTEFAAIMNERAKEIGVKNSNFVNPHGYHNENHYTTAYDLALITREALKNPVFREIVKQPSANIGSESSPNQQKLSFRNRNLLLDSRNSNTYYPYATGVKTGFTDEAGECLVASATKDNLNLIAVLLNSPVDARWNDAKTLFDYGFENFQFHQVAKKGDIIDKVYVDKHSPKGPSELEVLIKEDYTGLFHKNDISRIQKTISWAQEPLVAPITEGQNVGEVTFILDGEILSKIELIAKYGIEKRTIWDVMFSINAIPYWCGGIGGVLILFTISNAIRKRKSRRGFHFK